MVHNMLSTIYLFDFTIFIFSSKFFFIYHLFFILYISFCGIFLSRRNIIILLVAIETMLVIINLMFLYFAVILDDLVGEMVSLFILTISAAESAIGLSLVILYYRNYNLFLNS